LLDFDHSLATEGSDYFHAHRCEDQRLGISPQRILTVKLP